MAGIRRPCLGELGLRVDSDCQGRRAEDSRPVACSGPARRPRWMREDVGRLLRSDTGSPLPGACWIAPSDFLPQAALSFTAPRLSGTFSSQRIRRANHSLWQELNNFNIGSSASFPSPGTSFILAERSHHRRRSLANRLSPQKRAFSLLRPSGLAVFWRRTRVFAVSLKKRASTVPASPALLKTPS